MNTRLAVPFSEGEIFQHFGKTTRFKIYDIADDRIVSSEVVATDGAGHEALGLWLVQHAVNAVICGDIGPGAQGALHAAGVFILAGVTGSADAAVAKLLEGTLEATHVANCRHHARGGCASHCGGGCSGCCHSNIGG